MEPELLCIRINLVKVILRIGQEKHLLSIWKLIYKIKDLNGEKIIRSFYEKLLFKIILKNNFK